MKPQRRFAPTGGLIKSESVAGLARMRNMFDALKSRCYSLFNQAKRDAEKGNEATVSGESECQGD